MVFKYRSNGVQIAFEPNTSSIMHVTLFVIIIFAQTNLNIIMI